MTTLVETLFLKFQKCLAVAQKELKPPVPNAAVHANVAGEEEVVGDDGDKDDEGKGNGLMCQGEFVEERDVET
jgi:hypothetical protein